MILIVLKKIVFVLRKVTGPVVPTEVQVFHHQDFPVLSQIYGRNKWESQAESSACLAVIIKSSDSLKRDEGGGHLFGNGQKSTEEAVCR